MQDAQRLIGSHPDAHDATTGEKAAVFLKVMAKVVEVGDNHIAEERARTKKLLGGNLSDARKAKFSSRVAILDAFVPSLNGEGGGVGKEDGGGGGGRVRDGDRAGEDGARGAGGAGDVVVEMGSNVPLGHPLRREFLLKQRAYDLLAGEGAKGEGGSAQYGVGAGGEGGDLGETLMRLAEHFSQDKYPAEAQVMVKRAAEYAETANVMNPDTLYGIGYYYG